jgi:hypothetical protein
MLAGESCEFNLSEPVSAAPTPELP